jgi:hypothetical protein
MFSNLKNIQSLLCIHWTLVRRILMKLPWVRIIASIPLSTPLQHSSIPSLWKWLIPFIRRQINLSKILFKVVRFGLDVAILLLQLFEIWWDYQSNYL